MYEVLRPGPQHLSKATCGRQDVRQERISRGICGPASLVYAMSLSLKVLGLKDQYLGIPLATVLAHTYIMVTHILVTLIKIPEKSRIKNSDIICKE